MVSIVSTVGSTGSPGYSYEIANGGLHAISGVLHDFPILVYVVATSEGVVLVERELVLPAGARLDRATFVIGASPAGANTLTSSVATVRESAPLFGTGPACVIDFGRMVTVAGVGAAQSSGVAISSVAAWTGAAWTTVSSAGSFAERTTDRLLVQGSSTGGTFLAGMQGGTVALPAQPQGLELLVDGNTVWFERQGSTPDLTAQLTGAEAPTRPPVATYAVDRTEPVREAFARARELDGGRTVSVALRAPAPGNLALQPSIAMLHEHLVQFGADALSRTVETTEEGVHRIPLAGPGPDGTFAATDTVRTVGLDLRGSFGRERVQPVTGPALEDEVSLVLGSGRVVLLGLPRTLTARFGELSGIRLRMRTGARGAEVAGRLLGLDAQGGPGAELAGGQIAPHAVAAQQQAWTTLSLAEAIELTEGEGDIAAWAEVTAAYGEVELGLTRAAPEHPTAPGAPARRRLPGGGTVPLAVLADFGPLGAAMRLVGTAGAAEPLPAVEVSVSGADEVVGANPSGDALAVSLVPAGGLVPSGGQPELVLSVAAAGTTTASNVRILYSVGDTP